MALASSSAPELAPRVVALIPGYNEGPRIGRVVRATLEHLPVIVVDDGSADDTAARAREAGALVVEQRPNQGKGAALRSGFGRAIAAGYDGILTLDGDGQHDPAEIPDFLGAFRAGDPRPMLVVGRRNFRTMPPSRRLANELGGRAFSWAVGRSIPDNQSGYRLVDRRLAEAMLESDESGFEFEVEMITTCLRLGGTIAWVPIRTIYGAPSHIRPLAHLRQFIRIVRKARRDIGRPPG